MSKIKTTLAVAALLSLSASAARAARTAATTDAGWPRVFTQGADRVTVHQPQVDSWEKYERLHLRSAIAVKGGGLEKEVLGVVEIDATTVTNLDARVVAIVPTQRDVRFPNLDAAQAATARQVFERLRPMGQATTISLDRALAYVDAQSQPVQKPVELSLEPPTIFHSASPAILVNVVGAPQRVAIAPDRKDLEFVINTNWDLLYDTAGGRYYLLAGEGWLSAADPVAGPWTTAVRLPASLSALPDDENWVEVRQRVPGRPLSPVPRVFVSTSPAELIVTDGQPRFRAIAGTRLQQVSNTDALLFRHTGDGRFYLLVAGRWFRTAQLGGRWEAASNSLPSDFARIPASDAAAFVKASVPGTQEAQDAILLASVPNSIEVERKPVTATVIYSGKPQYVLIDGTNVQSAVNTSESVFLVEGVYYWCSEGAWLTSASAAGPWAFATSVPAAIYTIPPSHPSYNVTYVTVVQSTPTTVVFSQTSGYSGEYVSSTGVLMFGVGLLVGAAIADDDHHHYLHYYPYPYYYPRPYYYSYGCGAVYHYGYGGYYATARHYGPYGGAGWAAGYNPVTGVYARGAYAYGPYGAVGVRQAYNPYTGSWAHGAAVAGPYGSARRGAAYNARTDTFVAGRSVSTPYGSAGQFYAERNGNSAWGGYRSNAHGSTARVRTEAGAGAVAWDTRHSEGVVAKSKSGDVYVGRDDTIYKREQGGGWSSNSGSGWESVERNRAARASKPAAPRPSSSPSTYERPNRSGGGAPFEQVQREAQSRQRGNANSQKASQFRGGSSPSRSKASGGGRSPRN